MKRICVGDLEGNGLLDTVTKIHCGVFIDVNTKEVFQFRPSEIPKMLKFMDTCSTLIFHHGYGYDFPALANLYGYEYKGTKLDTLTMSRMLFPDRLPPKGVNAGPHSVESWGATFGRHKPENEDWSVFTEHMLHRCTEDSHIQLQLYHHCMDSANKTGWPINAFKLSTQLFKILHEQEQNGWPADKDRLHKNISMLSTWIDRIDAALTPHLPWVLVNPYGTEVKKPFKQDRSLAQIAKNWFTTKEEQSYVSGPFTRIQFRRTNLQSPAELKDFLLKEGWQPRDWNYKKDPKTKRPMKDAQGNLIRSSPKLKHDDPFIGIQGQIGRLAAKRVQCSSRRSILNGWLESIRPDGTISQRITGIAATGRLTHSGIVNVPGNESFFGKQMRKVFVSRRGYSIVGTDSAGCQDRMLLGRANANGVNDPVFEDMLLNGNKSKGTDSHSRAAAALNEVFKRNKLRTITRQSAKNFNYAYKFNAMDKKLGDMANASVKIGTEIRAALDGIFTAQVRVQEILVEEWRSNAMLTLNKWGKPEYKHGWFRGLDGRPIRVKLEKDVLVYALQSDEAIMMQFALCFLYKWCLQKGWKHGREFLFVANVHDEYQCLVRDDLIDEYIPLANKSIGHAAKFLKIQCPHKGESDVGKNWYETH